MMTLAEKREKTYQYSNKRLEAQKKNCWTISKGRLPAALSIKTERLKLLVARDKGWNSFDCRARPSA
jgi:hypothetical protein